MFYNQFDWRTWLTWLIRIGVGATFAFSGFVKGIDPWGTIFKINDYLAAMGLSLWPTLVGAGAIAMCVFEFLIGIFIILGCFRRSAPLLGLLFMAVMLPLTAWIWYSHPVSECGCFGDALVISDGATFWKNVFLTLGFIWLLKFNRLSRCLITPYLQWVATVASGLFLFVIAEIGYLYQPLLDFRPFSIGKKLSENSLGNESDSDNRVYEFIYRRGNEEIIVGEDDDLPSESDGWEFIETREKVGKGSLKGKDSDRVNQEKSLQIWDNDREITQEIIPGEGKKLWLMMPKLSDVSISETWEINTIYDWCERHGVEMTAIVNGNKEEIEEWEDLSLSEYPIYTSEDTLIKEVVRGKASLVYTVDGDIRWKKTLRSAWNPGFENDDLNDLSELESSNSRVLLNLTLIYFTVILVLISLSFSTELLRGFRPRKKGT